MICRSIVVALALLLAIIGLSEHNWTERAKSSPASPTSGPQPLTVTFSASPISGSAPLTVTLVGRDSSVADNRYLYQIEFGDGKTWGWVGSFVSEEHTYIAPGKYVAKFDRAINGCYGSKVPCTQPVPTGWDTIGTATVTALSSASL
jgi:hypothetical protein